MQKQKNIQDEQFEGWPITINMEDNFGKEAVAWLPEIQINGLKKPPVIQIIDEQINEIVYTLRIKGFTFKPKVFNNGPYTIIISEPGTDKMIKTVNVETIEQNNPETLNFDF